MVEFVLDDFVASPSVEKLLDLRKVDWVSLSQHYEVNIRSTCRKEEIKIAVVKDLVSKDVLPSDALSMLPPSALDAISENHIQNGTTHARVLKTRRPSCQLVELLLEDLIFFFILLTLSLTS